MSSDASIITHYHYTVLLVTHVQCSRTDISLDSYAVISDNKQTSREDSVLTMHDECPQRDQSLPQQSVDMLI